MASDLSFIHLIMNASPLVQLVMASLVLASVISWTMIFDRSRVLKRARRAAEGFEQRFWSGGDLAELYREMERENGELTGMASIFHAGFKEFARLRKNMGIEPMAVVEGARRSMHVALSREMDQLETNLSFLATVGSTSPYVGLFGTVWGIMNSFHALGNVKQATLSLVAPGIAEALIATAMGLFAAIPAVVAYNRYSNDVERLNGRYEDFLDEFTTILQRQAHVAHG
jgi:biopolymer transport protein TolQ